MSTYSKSELGKKGEECVATYLQQHGYTIVAFNYRLRCGEIDIIAQAGEVVAFVEVKMRRTDYFNLSEVVLKSKQRKIIATAKRFAFTHPQLTEDKVLRFDIALVQENNASMHVNYFPNAFTQDYGF